MNLKLELVRGDHWVTVRADGVNLIEVCPIARQHKPGQCKQIAPAQIDQAMAAATAITVLPEAWFVALLLVLAGDDAYGRCSHNVDVERMARDNFQMRIQSGWDASDWLAEQSPGLLGEARFLLAGCPT